jgi:hypothetical protein
MEKKIFGLVLRTVSVAARGAVPPVTHESERFQYHVHEFAFHKSPSAHLLLPASDPP